MTPDVRTRQFGSALVVDLKTAEGRRTTWNTPPRRGSDLNANRCGLLRAVADRHFVP